MASPPPPPSPRSVADLPGDLQRLILDHIPCSADLARMSIVLDIVPPNARCFGSHDGVWLFLATLEPRAHVALNIRSGHTRAIPTDLLRRTDPQRLVHGMIIHAAALTTSPEEAGCVGAGVVTSWPLPVPGAEAGLPPHRRCIAVWRQDRPLACDFVMPPGDGAFAFLTSGENFRACTARPHGNDWLETEWETVRFRPNHHLYDPSVHASSQ
nr:unnamed protein product [Digitaria exilis]